MKYIFICIFISLFSCRNNEVENKLESAITEIETLKEKSKQDSISNIKNYETILDSLNSNTENSLDLSTQFEKLKSSIFVIYTSNDYETYQGTAFLIDNNGTCVSNFHVFNNTKRAILENNNGEKYYVEKIIKYDEEKDYILFKIDLNNEFINPLKISGENPKIGEECFTIGNPRGLNQTISKGIISGYRNEESLIQTTAEITHGSSGGPLFNNKGEVVGITTSGYGEANLNFALNINQINFIKNNDYNIKTNNSFVTVSEKTYFHNKPNITTKRNAYLLEGAIGNVIESRNGFVYIIFKNTRNQISKGWINIDDIKFL